MGADRLGTAAFYAAPVFMFLFFLLPTLLTVVWSFFCQDDVLDGAGLHPLLLYQLLLRPPGSKISSGRSSTRAFPWRSVSFSGFPNRRFHAPAHPESSRSTA
jgi:hypothetical protein